MNSDAPARRWVWLLLALPLASGCAPEASVRKDESAEVRDREPPAELTSTRQGRATPRPKQVFEVGTTDPTQREVPLYPDEHYEPTIYTGAVPILGDPEARASDVQGASGPSTHFRDTSAIVRFAGQRCPLVPQDRRAVCPLLGAIRAVEQFSGGIRIVVFGDADALIHHMKCHQAFGRTRPHGRMPDCPLFLAGVEIRRTTSGTVEFLSDDPDVAAELMRRLTAHQR